MPPKQLNRCWKRAWQEHRMCLISTNEDLDRKSGRGLFCWWGCWRSKWRRAGVAAGVRGRWCWGCNQGVSAARRRCGMLTLGWSVFGDRCKEQGATCRFRCCHRRHARLALAAVQRRASGSCGSRRTATARTTFTHASISMIQRRWRSAYLSMLLDANRENSNRLPCNLPSVMSRLNFQWGIRGG